jgi:hypothetical protein
LRAEAHLAHIEAYSAPSAIEEPNPVLETVRDPAVRYEGYTPYMCRQPFQLPMTPNTSKQLTSSTIVYNLGLVHQVVSKVSAKAAAFYEISSALLSSEAPTDETFLLRVALMNNFGVWSYLNGEGETLSLCMDHLSTVLREPHPEVDADIERYVKRNILWFLTPPTGGSPAA